MAGEMRAVGVVPAACLVFSLALGVTHAQAPLHVFPGRGPGDQLGTAVAMAGDVDRDGAVDVIAGAPYAAAWTGLAIVWSGATGAVLYTFAGAAVGDRYGSAVSGAGDIDGDGHADLLIGAPFADGSGPDAGRAEVRSGRDGTLLLALDGAAAGDGFGHAVCGAGDLDGNGIPELLIGAPYADVSAPDAGSCSLFSANGSLRFRWDSARAFDLLGWAVAAAGDVDGDGFGDVMASAIQPVRQGMVTIYSGRTGVRIRTVAPPGSGNLFGSSVAGVGDLDGDGKADYAIGQSGANPASQFNAGAAWIYTGGTGAVHFSVLGPSAFREIGLQVAGAADVDGDGTPDVLVAGDGAVTIHSGSDGSTLRRWDGSRQFDFGWSAAAGGDLNRDGTADVVVGAAHADPAGGLSGAVHAFSGAPLALSATVHSISTAFGGRQTFGLDAGTAAAGWTYLVVGSLSGTTPGLRLGNTTLPLNLDGYLQITASFPNQGPFVGTLGTLDANGRAAAALDLSSGLPQSTTGTVFHHAFVAFDATGTIRLASNPVPLLLVRSP